MFGRILLGFFYRFRCSFRFRGMGGGFLHLIHDGITRLNRIELFGRSLRNFICRSRNTGRVQTTGAHGIRQEVRDGAVGIDGERLHFENPAPVLESAAELAGATS